MGLESATWLDDLVTTNPVSNDNVGQGDDHLRLLKTVLKTTFPVAGKAFRFPRVLTKTAAYSVLSTDDNTLFVADGTSAVVPLTLPTLASGDAGWSITVYAANVANAVSVLPPAGTISGEASVLLTKQYATVKFSWTGTTFIYEQDDLARKLRDMTAARLWGRRSSSAGAGEEVSLGAGLSMSASAVLSATMIPPIAPQGYLTLSEVSGSPIIVADHSAKTAVYYDFKVGDLVPINTDGATFSMVAFTRMTLTLAAAAHSLNTLYDVFIADDPGTPGTLVIGTGPAWGNSAAGTSARGTGAGTTELERLHGIWVNKVAMTITNNATSYSIAAREATFVGTIRVDGTAGQISEHLSFGQSRRCSISNAYNRTRKFLRGGDGTGGSDSGSSYAALFNTAANSVDVVQCLAEEWFDAHTMYIGVPSAGIRMFTAVGVNSTTVASGFEGDAFTLSGQQGPVEGNHKQPPILGLSTFTHLTKDSSGAASVTIGAGETANAIHVGYMA